MNEQLITAERLWQGVGELEPDFNLTARRSEDNFTVSEFYFNGAGETGGSCVRAFGMLVAAEGGGKKPPMLALCDPSTGIDIEFIKSWAEKGYAVLTVDLKGAGDGTAFRRTFYGADAAFADWTAAEAELDDTNVPPERSCRFMWTTVARRALSLFGRFDCVSDAPVAVVAIGAASLAALVMSAFDDRTGASIIFFGDATEDATSTPEERQYSAALSMLATAQHVKKPVLIMAASNETRYNISKAFEISARIPAASESLMSVSARLTRQIGYRQAKNPEIWLGAHASGEKLPARPGIAYNISDDKLYFTVTAGGFPAESCRLFYAYGGSSADRNWNDKRMSLSGENEYIAYIDAFAIDVPIYVYAVVNYEGSLSVCTRMVTKTAAEFGISGKPLVKSRLLYDNEEKINGFTTLGDERLIRYEKTLEFAEGPFGIYGVSALTGYLATYKPGDIRFRAEEDYELQVNVCSEKGGPMKIIFRDRAGAEFAAEVQLSGGAQWQRIVLPAQKFKNEAMVSLENFCGMTLLCFYTEAKILVSSILWS